jgi:hypothetical protein
VEVEGVGWRRGHGRGQIKMRLSGTMEYALCLLCLLCSLLLLKLSLFGSSAPPPYQITVAGLKASTDHWFCLHRRHPTNSSLRTCSLPPCAQHSRHTRHAPSRAIHTRILMPSSLYNAHGVRTSQQSSRACQKCRDGDARKQHRRGRR